MDSPEKLKVTVKVLGMTLLIAFGGLGWMAWQAHVWRQEVDSVAEQAGEEWAWRVFRADRLILYEYDTGTAKTNGMPVFSGRRDGPFDVWLWPDYADLPMQSRYSQRKILESFNWRMRDLYKHRKFYQGTNGVAKGTIDDTK